MQLNYNKVSAYCDGVAVGVIVGSDEHFVLHSVHPNGHHFIRLGPSHCGQHVVTRNLFKKKNQLYI
jgi:hypothetical protein